MSNTRGADMQERKALVEQYDLQSLPSVAEGAFHLGNIILQYLREPPTEDESLEMGVGCEISKDDCELPVKWGDEEFVINIVQTKMAEKCPVVSISDRRT